MNLGSGNVPLRGYVNVDKYADEPDIRQDVLTYSPEGVTEVVAYHLLEHMSAQNASELLKRAKAWMKSGGSLEVETPDMEAIIGMEPDTHTLVYIYGNHAAPGEGHCWGYTLDSLKQLVADAGWIVDEAKRFLSEEGQRKGMPCISVRAHRA